MEISYIYITYRVLKGDRLSLKIAALRAADPLPMILLCKERRNIVDQAELQLGVFF